MKQRIRAVIEDHPGYGYRPILAELNDGSSERVNHKRLRRVLRTCDLGLPRCLPATRTGSVQRLIRQAGSCVNLVRGRDCGALEAFATDFTELPYAGGTRKAYLIALLDLGSRWVARGRGLEELGTPFARCLQELPVGDSRVLSLAGQRVRCRKAQFLDKGFPRAFILMEELTEELRLSEKAAYEKVIRLLAHEVNNSTGAVNSLLHSCLHYGGQLREADRGDFENALQVASGRIDRLSSFMGSFAEVVQLPAPRLQPVDLEALLRGIALLMRAECERREIEWEWDVQADLDPVPMDENQMEQVFVNILKNAMEAIGDKGRIRVRLGHTGGRPFAAVEDTGPGIDPEAAGNLFTPFFSTRENRQGLGLTLVQEILTRHGFGFSLESPPSEPTRFTIRF